MRISRNGPQGFVLIAAAVTIVVLIGMLGLATDLARMYIVKNELQAFVDAASISGANKLDGTSAGLEHAKTAARDYPGKWNFYSTAPQGLTVSFSDQPNGTYAENPPSAAGLKYVQVNAEGPLTLYFLPGYSTLTAAAPVDRGGVALGVLLFTIGRTQTLRAQARSGQLLITTFSNGLIPYSPDAINVADTSNFGYTQGSMYTLRWPPNGQRDKKNQWCDGDEAAGFITPAGSSDRGFIDIAGDGSSDIRDAIVNNAQIRPVSIGDVVVDRSGNRGTESDALRERWGQDADTTSWTYSAYSNKMNDLNYSGAKGNGRRVVTVPVRNADTNVVLGFAGFFLHEDVCRNGGDSSAGSGGNGNGQGNSSTCCGEYIGPVLVPSHRAGSNTVGAFRVKLFK